jgi:hypothetical protein
MAQVAYAVARVLLVVGGAWSFGLEGAVVGYVLAPLLGAVPLVTSHPSATVDLAPVRARMAKAVVPISLVSIAVTAYFVVDVFALSGVAGSGSHEVGLYVAYGTVAHVPFFLLQAASVVMVPALAATRAAGERIGAIRRTMTDSVVLLAGPTLIIVTAGDAASRVVFGAKFDSAASIAAPLAIATAAVTILANLIAVDVAIGRMRTSLVIALSGAALTYYLAHVGAVVTTLGLPMDAQPPSLGVQASNVARMACTASVIAAVALAIQVRVRHRALVEWGRSLRGVVLATVLALPPLLADDDLVRTGIAVVCGLAWVGLVLKLGLVDVRRGESVAVVTDTEHA